VAAAVLQGLAPVLGKLALRAGIGPFSLVAARTTGAAGLLLIVVLIFRRRYLFIYPLGLAGCAIAGILNGLGSILFYSGLARLDASLAQLLFALYPIVVAFLLYLDGLRHTRLTLISLVLSIPAVILLTWLPRTAIDPLGVALMLGAGALYALHIPVNQRVLYEVPAPTVTLYTLLAMTAVVLPAHFLSPSRTTTLPTGALYPLLGLTVVTFLSRLTLFAGVKSIGGMRTSLIGLGELLVTLSLGLLWLGERLRPQQWAGALLLIAALILAGRGQPPTVPPRDRGWLDWLGPRWTRPASTVQPDQQEPDNSP
jgi:drug/metabolite transporter (DMT)-like permease